MTRQIVIKLNEEKFKPLLDKLKASGNDTSKSYSESVGKCIFFTHSFIFDKNEELGNKTRLEKMLESENKTPEEGTLLFIKQFNEFIKKSNFSHH